jgi:pimeloyl-ACP methyl ester carboxylesterase
MRPILIYALLLGGCGAASGKGTATPTISSVAVDAASGTLTASGTGAAQAKEVDVVLPGVALGGDVTADINLSVFSNPNRPEEGQAALTVHGWAHTGDTFERFARALFQDPTVGDRFSALIAMDLPGHGDSGPPIGAAFGALALSNYVNAVIGTLDALHARGVHPRTIVGHSMGGLIVILAQQKLVSEGTDLRHRFGIDRAILVAAAPPAPLPWAASDGAQGIVALLTVVSPTLGAYVAVPPPLWEALFFTNFQGDLAAGTPSLADVAAQGYDSPEAVIASAEVFGDGKPRPTASAGILARPHGTRLFVLQFEQDGIGPLSEQQGLYTYLTGDQDLRRFASVPGVNAVHDMYVAQPQDVVAAYGSLQGSGGEDDDNP